MIKNGTICRIRGNVTPKEYANRFCTVMGNEPQLTNLFPPSFLILYQVDVPGLPIKHAWEETLVPIVPPPGDMITTPEQQKRPEEVFR